MITRPFAEALVAQYLRAKASQKPLETRLAEAELRGLYRAADALRLAHTPFHMEITLLEAVRAEGERPAFVFTSPFSSVHAWDARVADRIMAEMGWLA